MKKLTLVKIAILVVGILLIATVLYKVYQVKNFQKDLRPLTQEEKQRVINILDANMNITGSNIIFGNVFINDYETLVQVQIKEGNLRKSYLIDLDNNNLVRKYNEE